MAMTDPLGDMLTRIRNGQQAKKDSVLTPASTLRVRVLDVLQREGYIRGYSEEALGAKGQHKGIRIELKYFEGQPAIRHDDLGLVRYGAKRHAVPVAGAARSLGLELVAEGVERESQRRYLLELGVPIGQGFLFAPGLPPDEMGRRLAACGGRNIRQTRLAPGLVGG